MYFTYLFIMLNRIKCLLGFHTFVYEYGQSHSMPRRQCTWCGLLQGNSRIDYKWTTIGKFEDMKFEW